MKSKELDQFYTKRSIAVECYAQFLDFLKVNQIEDTVFLEPSAGSGAFYSLLPSNKLGIDLEPKIDGVICHDFLTYPLERNDYLTIGNPPFGKNSSLAVKFFNKCAEHSKVIAFVLPKTFKKTSILKKLNKNFHLSYEYDLPDFSFEFDSKDYNVSSVFQIWAKLDTARIDTKSIVVHEDFLFTTKEKGNFAIQRVGAAAGSVKENFSHVATASHYFISAPDDVKNLFKKIDWTSVKYNTAGNPSISKPELIALYEKEKARN